MKWLIDLLFHCRHRRTTFPQTHDGHTYTACLECGAELAYESDWINTDSAKYPKANPGLSLDKKTNIVRIAGIPRRKAGSAR
jgi:hypothetical protein